MRNAQQLHSIDGAHPNVGHHQVKGIAVEILLGFLASQRRENFIALRLQQRAKYA